MRNTLNPCRRMLLSVVLLFLPGVVMASGFSDTFAGKVTKDPQAREQIKNAVDALESLGESVSTKGEATAGGSGPMMQLIYNSDTLICSAWIIAFRQELQRLVIHDAPLETIRAAQDLLSRVERACQGVLDPDTAATATAPGTGSEAAPPPTEAPSAGQPFTPRPGWTITDEICARKCSAESAADQRADWNKYRAEENERKARERLSAAERELAAERENLAKAEARLEAARANLARREDFAKRLPGGDHNALTQARANAASAQRELSVIRNRVASKEAAVASARAALDQATAARERAEQEAANAQAALDSCLRDCYRQAARGSGTSSVGTSSGASTGTATSTSSGTSTGTTTSTSSGTSSGFTGFQPDPNAASGE